MDKAFLERLDKSEEKRLKDFESSPKENQSVDVFIKSKVVIDTFKMGSQALIGGFSDEILPNAIPFSDRVFVEVCPCCPCTKTPKKLLPYLERDLIIPVLTADFIEYNPDFIELITAYPYLSGAEFHGLRNAILAKQSKIKLISQAEIDGLEKSCINAMEKKSLRPKSSIETLFGELQPYYSTDLEILLDFLSSLQKCELSKVNKIRDIATIINQFRYSQVFPLIPQLEVGKMQDINLIPAQHKGVEFQQNDVNQSILSGLKMSYNTSMDLPTFLDVVSKHKHTIRKIVKDIIVKSNPEDDAFLVNLREEIEKMNLEIRELRSSKKILAIDLITNFTWQNKTSIIAGLVTAASLGLGGLGLISCGAAGVVSSVTTKAASRVADFSIPEEAQKLKVAFSTSIEPYYETALARILSSNKQAIQLWHIQRKLK